MFDYEDTDETWALPPVGQTTETETELPPAETPPPPAPAPMPDSSARTAAGVSILLAGSGALVGFLVGGGWGAGAGLLAAGAARNGYKARQLWTTDRAEAAKRLTMAVAGAAGGGYFAYRSYNSRKKK